MLLYIVHFDGTTEEEVNMPSVPNVVISISERFIGTYIHISSRNGL